MFLQTVLWILIGVCVAGAVYGLVIAIVPRWRPMLRRGGQVPWPAFVCLMMSCIFIGLPLMVLAPLLRRPTIALPIVWIYYGCSVAVIGFAMWRERIGRSSS
ncbi:MAG TPA: hypothetical protein VF624_16800 [Tepidisphaeraceae bacterium]|jgi:hypothetical protein